MENQINLSTSAEVPTSSKVKVPLKESSRRCERIARIVYLIAAALCLYALLLSSKARAAETAALVGNHHPPQADTLTAQAPADTVLKIE